MEPNIVYQKTRKGEDEIKTRGAKLAPKVRAMLILIDGSKTRAQLDDMAKRRTSSPASAPLAAS